MSVEQITEFIAEGNLSEIRKIDNLQPVTICGPFDVLCCAVENYKGDLSIIKYLVEEKNIQSNRALNRALECAHCNKSFINLAIYLKNCGMFLVCKKLPLSCLATMKLVTSWGLKYDREDTLDRIFIWHGDDIFERVEYLYEVLQHPYPVTEKQLEMVKDDDDDTFYFLINHCSVEQDKLSELACRKRSNVL